MLAIQIYHLSNNHSMIFMKIKEKVIKHNSTLISYVLHIFYS